MATRPIKFRYVEHDADAVKFLPMVRLQIAFKSRRVNAYGLVDSGSTRTYVPAAVADALGIAAKDCMAPAGRSESLSGKFTTLQAEISRMDIVNDNMIMDSFVRPVILITRANTAVDFVVLGRDHIFSRYDITFSERQKRLTLVKARPR